MNPDRRLAEEEDEDEPGHSVYSDLTDMLKWALLAVAITVVFGGALNVLEAVL